MIEDPSQVADSDPAMAAARPRAEPSLILRRYAPAVGQTDRVNGLGAGLGHHARQRPVQGSSSRRVPDTYSG